MTTQLTLIDEPLIDEQSIGAGEAGYVHPLDPRTRELGLAGVARCRAVLAEIRSRRAPADGESDTPHLRPSTRAAA